MGEWKATTIGTQVRLQRGFDITKRAQQDGSIPVVSSSGIASYHNEAAARGPGVILGRKGVVGSVYFVTSDYWPHDTTLWVKDFKGNDPRFVYYFFKAKASQLALLDVGSANPTLNRNHVHPTPTLWPSQSEQESISRLLGALDDKIELNREMNETLEATARALNRSWFVDFDPVVTKSEGRKPNPRKDDLTTLFPDAFEDSDLGPIPSRWSVGSVADLARFVNGKNFTKAASNTGRMVIRIMELNSGPGASTVYSDAPAEIDNVAGPGDILFSWSGSLGIYRWSRDAALINQHIFKVVSVAPYPQWFVYYALLDALPFFREIAEGKATTMGHIKREHLQEARLAIPPTPLIEKASETIGPLYSMIHENGRESLLLAQLRDLLLPKLISGEIRLKEAEKLVSDAV